MSTNCLVTKLKGSVTNDNLPIFGKLIIRLKKIQGATTEQKLCFIRAGHKACNVEFVNTTLGSNPSSITIPAGASINGNLDLSNDNAYLIVDTYSIISMQINSASEYIELESCKYGELEGIAISVDKFSQINSFTALKAVVAVGSPNVDPTIMIQNNPGLLTLTGSVETVPVSILPVNSQIQNIKLAGNIADFPKTMKYMFINSTQVTGSVTAWVEGCRAAGRTTGKIQTPWLGATNNVTIDDGEGNEIGANTFITNKGITASTNIYLVWTADSIDITTDNSGVETPITISDIGVL